MTIDLAQFHQTFFEESFEGLEAMEGGLLHLDDDVAGNDTINTIFRAAHSIKGGSATFGFSEVAKFTHVLETLLDEMRAGHIKPTPESVDVLLQSVDCLREMLSAVKNSSGFDHPRINGLQGKLEQLLHADPVAASGVAALPAGEIATAEGWHITFKPHPHLLKSGNEPVRMLRELAMLGDLSATVDSTALPALAEIEPEACYLHWTLELVGAVPHAAIKDVFDWVIDDCDLELTPIAPVSYDTAPVPDIGKKDVPAQAAERTAATPTEGSSIRVNIDKVDALINMVGELVITQSMLSQVGGAEDFDSNHVHKLRDGLTQLERNTRELQESVMRIRMLPISFAFNRFPRMVHDLSSKLNKKIDIRMSGEQTELDKTVMEKISDPLVHLVRNSLDHGIETPEVRRAAGKPETGLLRLNAYHKGGNIVIEIMDDGAGLNKDKILKKAIERALVKPDEVLTDDKVYELIFMPGFSTADVISDVSGRGVGMDVVRRNISSVGGKIEIESTLSAGTTIRIRLPLTLAILDGMSIAVGEQMFILPLAFIIESLQPVADDIREIAGGQGQVVQMRGEYLPVISLYKLFGIATQVTQAAQGILVLVEAEGRKVALLVDRLVGQHQVVLKSLESNYRKVEGVSGATILGNGQVALILDASALVRMSIQ